MKTILGLAIATALASPMALADNPPSNVGDVTYMGNIVANSPMWKWTVNDYPGGRLDAKPSEVVEANGTYTYPLNGQAFIAASGYLPSFVGISATNTNTNLGTRDITSLTDQNGAAPANITDAQKGAVTFTIAASGYDTSGQTVEGNLKLKATEVRGGRLAWRVMDTGNVASTSKRVSMFGSTAFLPATEQGSCFIGTGRYSSGGAVVSGNADNPTPGEQSATAFSAFVHALTMADNEGSANRIQTVVADNNTAGYQTGACDTPSFSGNTVAEPGREYIYGAAAHIIELTPVELQFSAPLSGAWNSTLTVTAYTM